MNRTVSGRLAYADLLRVLAVMAAVVLLVSNGWIGQTAVGGRSWTVMCVYDALTRWCVPMFAMLSGAFLLDPKKAVRARDLLLKYIPRILIAMLVWGVLYILAENRSFTWAAVKSALLRILWADAPGHFWFLYVMLGLYLVTPILRAFVRGASRGGLHWFLLLAFVLGSLLPTLEALFPGRTALAAAWTGRMEIHMVLGYVGCYVAGYYLKNYTLGRIAEFSIYILGILGAVATVWGTMVLSARQGVRSTVLLDWLSPNVVLMAAAVFVLFRYVLGVSEERSRRQRLSGMAKISFGIYLLHAFFLLALRYFGISTLSFDPIISIPVLSAGVFLCAFVVAWLLSKIPLLGRFLT